MVIELLFTLSSCNTGCELWLGKLSIRIKLLYFLTAVLYTEHGKNVCMCNEWPSLGMTEIQFLLN